MTYKLNRSYFTKISLINYIKFTVFASIALCLIYFYYAATKAEIAIIYPNYTDAKIKPETLETTTEKSIHSLVSSKNNLYTSISIDEPEQAFDLSSLFSDGIDSIEEIISTIVSSDNKEKVEIEEPKIINSKKKLNTQENYNNILDISQTTRYRYSLQLAAVKSQAEGNELWNKVRTEHSKILAGLTPHIVKNKSSKNKFYYLLKVNGYDNINQARSVCNKLLKAKQTCLVIDDLEKHKTNH